MYQTFMNLHIMSPLPWYSSPLIRIHNYHIFWFTLIIFLRTFSLFSFNQYPIGKWKKAHVLSTNLTSVCVVPWKVKLSHLGRAWEIKLCCWQLHQSKGFSISLNTSLYSPLGDWEKTRKKSWHLAVICCYQPQVSVSSGAGRDDSSKLPGSFLLCRLLGSCFLDLENVSSSNNLGVAVSLGAILSLGCVGKGKAGWAGPVCFCYYDPGMPSYYGKFKNKISKQGNFKRLKEEAGDFSISDSTALHFRLDPPNIFNKEESVFVRRKGNLC